MAIKKVNSIKTNAIKAKNDSLSFKSQKYNIKNHDIKDSFEGNEKGVTKKASFMDVPTMLVLGALLTLGTIFGIKRYQNKAFEKQINKIYSEISKDIAAGLEKQGFKLELPKLEFISKIRGRKHNEMASCNYIHNIINVNKNQIMNPIYVIKNNNDEISFAYGKKALKILSKNDGATKIGELTKKEKEILFTELLAHETRHSVQTQMMLTKDKEAVLKLLSKNGNPEKLKGTWAYNYNATKADGDILLYAKLPSTSKFRVGDIDVNEIGYTAGDFIKGESRYLKDYRKNGLSMDNYYINPMEIDARFYSASYLEKKYGALNKLPENIKHQIQGIYDEAFYGLRNNIEAPIIGKDGEIFYNKAGNPIRAKF